jgi:O-antigen/teichoic acid export membrane protein
VHAERIKDVSAPGTSEPEPLGAAATTGASVLRGGAWYAVSRYLPQLYTLALSVVAARFLGPDGMGRQSYIAFVSVSLTIVLTSSFYVALMRYVGESIGRGRAGAARALLVWAWKVEGVLGAAAAAGLGGVALAGARPQGAWALAGVVCALGAMHAVSTAVLVGLQRFRDATIAGLTTGAFGVGAAAAVLAAGGGITGMFAVEAVTAAVNLVWTGTLARRGLQRVAPRAEPAPELRRLVTRYALISAIGVVLEVIVARRSEVFFLERFSTDAQIAFYSISFGAVTALMEIPRALASAISPAFATLHGAGAHDRIRAGFCRGLRLLLLATMPVLALSLVCAPRLLELFYGRDYSSTGNVLLVLLGSSLLIPATSLSAALLVGLARVRIPLIANALAAVVDLGLAAVLIPRLDAIGAAVANVGGVLAYGAVMNASAARLVGPLSLELRALARGATAAGLAGLAGWAVIEHVAGFPGLVAASAVVIALYSALARALRILPHGDALWLEGALGRQLKGVLGRACRLCAAPAREA